MAHNFESEQAAAKALLLDVTSLLNRRTIDYAVIGGWVPYLFNSVPVQHPGTFDVDIVLNTSLSKDHVIGALDSMVKDSHYRRAPKNAFQIYREIVVAGEPMIFHVDFLHRKYADDTDSITMSWGRYESISTAGTDVIFTEKEVRSERVTGIGLNGEEIEVNVPFSSEAGFLSAKGRSVGFGKRVRDGYDVYLVIKQSQNIDALKSRCRKLLSEPVFRKSMELLREQFSADRSTAGHAAEFLMKLDPRYMTLREGRPMVPQEEGRKARLYEAEREISRTVNSFLDGIGVSR